ncbi:polysaccharide deacetylase family protein [Flavobacterium sufflavum]|uniref:Polysaccharide deacetylase family protein n=1 Tax=Flavobacterium sufflavum TaxID=1921138 RepID=A0A3S2V4S2_9FLAO|nr:polysaccharide deacetylase family protein [Flavobacterium sufflavum]RVT76604.1 polysaccharide deacetylase family protein [Flavobacterium sufflavum]
MTRLPILMYHNVSNDLKDSKGLTVFCGALEEQFRYLQQERYTTYHFSELENRASINPKSVVITFDDVTVNQLDYAVPLLQKYNLKATFFIPFSYIGNVDSWNSGKEKIMSIEQLKALDSRVELGLHSFAHKRYAALTEAEINTDFSKCFEIIEQNDLKVYNALAYPYGNYPKKEPSKSMFTTVLRQNNVKVGLRIGNRINKFPFINPYEIQRIDIKGEDSLLKFKFKLRFGKLKLF